MPTGFDVSRFGEGSDDAFALVQDFLIATGYTEEKLCEQLGIQDLTELGPGAKASAATDLMVQLFFIGKYVSRMLLETTLPPGVLEAMFEISLLVDDEDQVFSPILLYQSRGLYLASDRFTNPDGSDRGILEDFVFLAITPNTDSFMAILPPEPKGTYLDIGTGAGIAALHAAQTASQVCGSDITARSVKFAEFNRRLNGFDNVRFIVSDLYSALQSERFDTIVAHPPYVPGFQKSWIYSSGGDDGEEITRGIIEGLPDHLNSGGQAVLLTMGSDREGEPFEQRVRKWLGKSHAEFDVVVMAKVETLPAIYASEAVVSWSGSPDDVANYLHAFKKLKIQKLVYGAICVVRLSAGEARQPLTIRRVAGSDLSYRHLRWVLDWERKRPDLDYLAARPQVTPSLNVVTRHEVRDGDLVPVEYRISNTNPITVDTPCPAWVAFLLSQCNGQRTGRELYDIMKERAFVSESSFGEAIRSLGSAGVISFAASEA